MRMVIKFILYALVVILLVSWVSTVIKSCGEEDNGSAMTENYTENGGSATSEDDAIMDDLIEAEEQEAGSENIKDNSPAITSIDYSKKLDKDEEAMLEKVAREKEAAEEPAPKNEEPKKTDSPKTISSGGGNYFVITGSFGEEGNAKNQQKKLISMGYSKAEVVQFDGSNLHSVIAGRYTTNSEASRIAEQLKSKHKVDCFVKKREL